jgi:p-aminobenzoyl-glutamate transporter AbgT
MNINILAIIVATVVQFIIGAIWYTPLFGKVWGKIHGFDKHSSDVQKEMQKGMWKLLAAQFVITFVTTVVLAFLKTGLPPYWSVYGLAFFSWLGFVVPTQVAAVLFGGTEPQWVVKKILIMAGGSLLCLEAAAYILSMM